MTDRELLELAAKAAGIKTRKPHYTDALMVEKNTGGCIAVVSWNPLIDDGDALRLAVYLSINIQIAAKEASIVAATAPGGERMIERTIGLGDAAEATRLAITRAAAEIGKQK